MKIIFLTFAPLKSNAGHLARLKLELNEISEVNEVTVICLNLKKDDADTQLRYPKVRFENIPVLFNAWNVVDLEKVVDSIKESVRSLSPDLVVMQMEVWDLIRELSRELMDISIFTFVAHAMPFLGSPLEPTNDFNLDVHKFLETEIELYKKTYIRKYYKEAKEIFSKVPIITNNPTVSFYMKNYFKDIRIFEMKKFIISSAPDCLPMSGVEKKYDFVYMARMERGKGIEYLSKIFACISKKMGRKINVAILGRTDDLFSKDCLDNLLDESHKSDLFSVDFFGWAEAELKKEVFCNAGVFIYPSYYDNYPTVINEALTFGLPCVVWDVLFYKLCFFDVVSVLSAYPFDLEDFSNKSVYAFYNKDNMRDLSREFIRKNSNALEMSKADNLLFEIIYNTYVRN